MSEINVSLPESLQDFIDEQVARGAYASASEYLRALVREDQKRKARERLEELLIEGLESGPATEMTDADWDEMRRQFDERHRHAGGS
jgi:antitoxin ParD1/3/4